MIHGSCPQWWWKWNGSAHFPRSNLPFSFLCWVCPYPWPTIVCLYCFAGLQDPSLPVKGARFIQVKNGPRICVQFSVDWAYSKFSANSSIEISLSRLCKSHQLVHYFTTAQLDLNIGKFLSRLFICLLLLHWKICFDTIWQPYPDKRPCESPKITLPRFKTMIIIKDLERCLV